MNDLDAERAAYRARFRKLPERPARPLPVIIDTGGSYPEQTWQRRR